MKIIYNKWIPLPGFLAINLFGTMFVREEYKNMKISNKTINHESIHTAQALDFAGGCEKLQFIGYLLFYLFYLIEWLIKLVISAFTLGKVRAYRSISLEQEAYKNAGNFKYLENRKKWNWLKCVFKLIKK